ncbi:MAG: putative lipid II flippase FtsW [Pseudomonadota bacterium]
MASDYPAVRLSYLVVPWLALLLFGTIMVASAATALGGSYLTKHILYVSLSLLAFGIVFAVPPGWWSRFYLLGWALAVIVALIVLIPGVGHEVNGARRWIRVAGFTVQAAEVAKFGLCIYLAGYLARHYAKLQADPKVMLVPLGMVLLVCTLLIVEPDLGSAVVLVSAAAVLLYLAGAKLRYFLLILLLGGVALALLIEIAPYRMQRLVAFLDPWSVAFGSGYQLTQALIAFGRGELFGLGLGEGVQKLYYLPEAHNDFIFAVIAEELGAIGAIAVALLLAFFVVQIFRVARLNLQRGAHFAGFASYFVGLLLGFQFLVNLGVNTGTLPTKGLTLPFVSYGGNSLIVCCALIALVLRCGLDKTGATDKKAEKRS